ncbi:hypothetical protein [Methylomonas sp. YC3]
MTTSIANETTSLLPLASACIGFLGALFLYFLKERNDLKSRRREAMFFLLFFTNTLEKMISARALHRHSGSNFDEAIRKLASARLDYYSWSEISKLADINAAWIAGEYDQLVHTDGIKSELQTMAASFTERANKY